MQMRVCWFGLLGGMWAPSFGALLLVEFVSPSDHSQCYLNDS